jgi:uncharacterized membrane protein YjjP (DUF1212 family)
MTSARRAADQADLELRLAQLGALLLDAGLSVTDVRDRLHEIRDAVSPGANFSVSVLPSMVLASDNASGTARVVTADGAELTFRQAAQASRLARSVHDGAVPIDQIAARAEAIRSDGRAHPLIGSIIGSALISVGLAILFRCPWWAICTTLVVGALVGLLLWALDQIPGSAAVAPFIAALTSTMLVGAFAHELGLGPVPLFAVCAPIAVLVPGAMITNALLELTATDIVTGSARLAYGLIILGFMTAGIAAGAALTGLRIDPESAALVGEAASVTGAAGGWGALPPLWMSWAGVVILAVGIGAAFGSAARLTALNMAVMTATYGVLVLFTVPFGSVLATGITAGALFVVARSMETLTSTVPATVSFQPAFLLLVPGTVGLVAMASLDTTTLAVAPAMFASICIGTKIGAILSSAPRFLRRRHDESVASHPS